MNNRFFVTMDEFAMVALLGAIGILLLVNAWLFVFDRWRRR